MPTIVLDTFPLSSTAKAEPSPGEPLSESGECHSWIWHCIEKQCRIIVPAICFYETLRELKRRSAWRQIERLRTFCTNIPGRYLPITDADLELAADLWAQARNEGLPTEANASLDADVILSAQALNLGLPLTDFVIATTNPSHLSRFVPCASWRNITP